MITGCLQIAKSGLYTGFNNPLINSVSMCNYYTTAFGFTAEEVSKMLADFNLSNKEAKLKNWYDGYRFNNEEVYNPFSVSNHIKQLIKNQETKPIDYWANTSENVILAQMLSSCAQNQSIKDKFELLINGGSLDTKYSTSVTYSNMLEKEDAIFGTLLFTGYLTLDTDGKLYVPNKEVMSTFEELVEDYNQEQKIIRNPLLVDSLLSTDSTLVENTISRILMVNISINDLTKAKEYFVHSLLAGILIATPEETGWFTKSNYESGNSYPDIVFINSKLKRAIVLEIKRATIKEEMSAKVKEGENLYGQELIDDGYDVTRYAICFFKKEVKVRLFNDSSI